MKRIFLKLLLLSLLSALNADVVLVRNGIAQAEIVLEKNPRRAAAFAAAELQYHVKKITGATLPLVYGKATGKLFPVYVGETDFTRSQGLCNADFKIQEYLVSVSDRRIILQGHDREDRRKMDYSDWRTFPDTSTRDKYGQGGTGGFYEQGSCYAVYDFLEKLCGVRWYLPTELGLEYVPRKTLTVKTSGIRRVNNSHHRILVKELGIAADFHGDQLPGGTTDVLDRREAILWSRRMRLGGTAFACNHSLYGYYRRFLKTHPEFFAQGYTGRPPQLCYTNEALAEQVAQDARDFFDGKYKIASVLANGDFFSVMPMDNLHFCKCPNCQKLIKKENIRGSSVYTDKLSRYYYSFVNKIARKLAKTHPGKYITTAAYNHSSLPPEGMKLEKNVVIVMCLGIRQPYNSERRESDMNMIRQWHQAAPDNLKSVWLYFCYPVLDGIAGKYNAFPGFFSKDLIKVCREFHKYGVKGFFIEPSYAYGKVRNALLDQLELYLISKLFDDPAADGMALRGEFFRRYYGNAGKIMEQCINEMEDVFCDSKVQYVDEGVQTQWIAWGVLGTDERMKRWGKMLDEAERIADSPQVKKRLSLFRSGVWKYMLTGKKACDKTLPVRQATAGKKIRVPFISDKSWKNAAAFGEFYTFDGRIPGYKVNGKMKHDGKNLYIRMTADGPGSCFPLPARPPFFYNDGWWLYFAKQRSRPYHQLLINPDGTFTARAHIYAVQPWQIKPEIKVAYDKTVRRSIEIVLPFKDLTPGGARPGEKIYFNIIRGNPDVISAWIPTFTAGRDTPSRFGVMELEKENQ